MFENPVCCIKCHKFYNTITVFLTVPSLCLVFPFVDDKLWSRNGREHIRCRPIYRWDKFENDTWLINETNIKTYTIIPISPITSFIWTRTLLSFLIKCSTNILLEPISKVKSPTRSDTSVWSRVRQFIRKTFYYFHLRFQGYRWLLC